MNFTIRESNSELGWFLWMRSNDEWVHSITATSNSRKKKMLLETWNFLWGKPKKEMHDDLEKLLVTR